MFFSKRAFNALSSSSRCSGDKPFLLLLMFRALVALIVVASLVSYLLLRCAPPHGFFWLVFAFLSIRSFHAVPSAPVSTSSLAAARRICVCPIFPQPPGIGRKISGASSTNAACCSSVSIRFPYPPCLRGQRSKFPASYTKSRQSCVRVLFHPLQAQCNPAKACCGHVAGFPFVRESIVSHHDYSGWHVSTARGGGTGSQRIV